MRPVRFGRSLKACECALTTGLMRQSYDKADGVADTKSVPDRLARALRCRNLVHAAPSQWRQPGTGLYSVTPVS
jgi:hypothetical protein